MSTDGFAHSWCGRPDLFILGIREEGVIGKINADSSVISSPAGSGLILNRRFGRNVVTAA
jgi:hypothetical protein